MFPLHLLYQEAEEGVAVVVLPGCNAARQIRAFTHRNTATFGCVYEPITTRAERDPLLVVSAHILLLN